MKVIGICGSPRRDGNTAFATRYLLDNLSEKGFATEFIHVCDYKVGHCIACYGCVEAKRCVIKDDFETVYQKIAAADAVILATPVYHASVTPPLKSLMDRLGFSGRWRENSMKNIDEAYNFKTTPFSGKLGAPIAIARRAGTTSAISEMLLWYSVNDFIVVGSSYWPILMAGKGGAKDADTDEEGLSNLDHLANNFATLLPKLRT